jgi:hypothetical protein
MHIFVYKQINQKICLYNQKQVFVMKSKFNTLSFVGLGLLIGIFLGFYTRHNNHSWQFIKKVFRSDNHKNRENTQPTWTSHYQLIEIPSKLDNSIQKAIFYKSKSTSPKPLIVSLHTWTGDYSQYDTLSELCRKRDLNYIHPDFRGSNHPGTIKSCCSQFVISDIDEAISYAIKNSNTDTSQIYVIGGSGGGYAALCSFMKSKQKIKKTSVWASICNLNSWYDECLILRNNAVDDILNCTGSKNGILDTNVAKERSPIYWKTPLDKLTDSKITIYAGVYDGLTGPASITHSINFYNKILSDQSVKDSSLYVSNREKLFLLEYRRPLGKFGKIGSKEICLLKEFKNTKLVIFKGGHEMLTEYALENLLEPDNPRDLSH